MNRTIPGIGAAMVTIAVFLFAVCMLVDFTFGAYFVCMFLPLGYMMMAVGFQYESCENRRVPANIGVVLALSMQYWFFWYISHRRQASDGRI